MPEQEPYIVGPSTGWEQGCQINLEPIEDPLTRAFTEHRFRCGLTADARVHDAELEYRRLQERGDIVFREEPTRDVLGLHFRIEDTVGNVLSVHTD